MRHLDGIDVLVLGLGASGLAMARWCARFGAAVRVWDTRETPPNASALALHVPGGTLLVGPLTDAAFAGVQLVLKSPGLAAHDARLRGPLERARATGVAVQGELDLFVRALADLKSERGYAPKVIAVTGTNGKTTTVSMAAQLLGRTGKRVALAGNIGPTMLQTLADALDAGVGPLGPHLQCASWLASQDRSPGSPHAARKPRLTLHPLAAGEGARRAALHPSPAGRGTEGEGRAAPPSFTHLPDVWVLELSSFQLDGVRGFEPDAATVLNLSEDHLDWHGSMDAYVAAKRCVFGERTVRVVNRDDPRVEALVQPLPGDKGRRGKPVARPPRVVRFGLDAPRRPGDFGLVEEHGMAWLVRARELDETLARSRGARGAGAVDAEAEEMHLQRLMPADALRVRGRHNAANALAALALGAAIDCPLAPMLHGLREYAGEPHRVQFVASADGVDAYDDSKGTNVGATVAALNGLGADRAPAKIVVILGGDAKGQDFAPLAAPVRAHVRGVALIGRDAGRIEAALAGIDVPMQHHANLPAAVRWCYEQAARGDAVLLSPACASLDMFRDYAHRADVFVAEVQSVVAELGGVAA